MGLNWWRRVLLTLVLWGLGAAALSAVTASWSPNPEPDIAGYRLSYGLASGVYTTTVDVGNVTSFSVNLPAGGPYYVVVAAYNTAGLVGPMSQEIVFPPQPMRVVIKP